MRRLFHLESETKPNPSAHNADLLPAHSLRFCSHLASPLPALPGYVLGELRNRVLVINDPDRNASASETSSNTESRVFAPDDDHTYLLRVHRRLAGGVFHNAVWNYRRLFERWEASSREANSVPATKYSKGPKVRAAVAPIKCSPRTELRKPPASWG